MGGSGGGAVDGRKVGSLRIQGDDIDETATEFDVTFGEGVDGVILPSADEISGFELGPTLPNDDGSTLRVLAAVEFDATELGV